MRNSNSTPARGIAAFLTLALLLASSALVHAQPAPPPTARPKKVPLTPRTTPEVAPDGNLIFWRRVSSWEKRNTLKIGKLFLPEGTGEKFVSVSREYVDQLAERHPKDYAITLRIELAPEAWAELEKIGRRAPDPFLEKLYPRMPVMTKDQPKAIHFKAELGVLNIGVRKESLDVFNKYLKSVVEVKPEKATAAKDRAADSDARLGEGLPPPSTNATEAKPAPTTTTTAARPKLDDLLGLSLGELMVRAQRQLGRTDVPETRPELMALLAGVDAKTVQARLEAAPTTGNLRGAVTGGDDARLGIDDAIKGRVIEGIR